MARESKWNEEVRKTILKWVGMGFHREVAAARARVSESMIARWLSQGEMDQRTYDEYVESGASLDDPEAPVITEYARFFTDYAEREAQAQIDLVKPIMESDDLEDRKWLAERRFPRQWSSKSRLEHTGPEGRPIEIVDARKTLWAKLDGMAERSTGVVTDGGDAG